MNRSLAIIAMSSAILVSSQLVSVQALAVGATSAPAAARRQMVSCMTKQMSASRTISYNEATKVCKDLLKSQSGSLAANTDSKPVTAR